MKQIKSTVPKNIFMFWHRKILPKNIKKYYENTVKINTNFKINLYHLEKINKEFPDIVPILEKIKNDSHKADLVRLILLYKYGGIWCDISTVFIKKMEEIFDLEYDGVQGFSVPFDMKEQNIMENSYICAPKNNVLIKLWMDEYVRAVNMNFRNYKSFFVTNYPNEKNFFLHLPYLAQHACLYHILKQNNSLRLKILPPQHFQLHTEYQWDSKKIRRVIKEEKYDKNKYVLIKLRGSDRMTLMDKIKKKIEKRGRQVLKILNYIKLRVK